RFLTALRIVRADKAVLAFSGAGPAGDDIAVDDEGAGSVAAVLGLGLPALFSGARVQSHHVTIRSRIEDDIVIDRKVFGAGAAGDIAGHLALVFPKQVAVSGIEGLDDGARCH